ncbi:hypothetical protein FIBSPDRAFT_1054911 [Athelia psychrophila]|uniref:Uncharacterized protein n=1 Tax=Athelia psychrophila TaxID=1759441 RepID=A0A167ULX1_9AGAM|nr:hypothetical protein FIBSPDRAFT_1054911 [Fibularhizoctonia sp. CBS 109695]
MGDHCRRTAVAGVLVLSSVRAIEVAFPKTRRLALLLLNQASSSSCFAYWSLLRRSIFVAALLMALNVRTELPSDYLGGHLVLATRKEKASKRESQDSADGSVPFDNTAFQPETSSVPSDPSLSSRASTTNNEIPVNRRVLYEHGGSLGHISEESQSGFEDAEESFVSTVPTTPAKTPKVLYESPSRLPVLKYIRRLSPLSSPTKGKAGKEKEKEKENAARASPSKLPRRAGPAQGSPRRAMFTRNPLMYSIP